MSKQTTPNISSLLEKAIHAFQREAHELAISNASKILTIQPDHFQALQLLGAAYYRAGDLPHALEFTKKALAYQEHAELYNTLGCIYKDLHQFPEGRHYFGKALELKPDYINARFNLALLLIQSDQHEAAIAELRCILDMAPGHIGAIMQLSELYLTQSNVVQAEATLTAGLVHQNDNAEIVVRLARLLHSEGKNNESAALLDQFLSRHPRSPNALLNRGIVSYDQDELETAIRYFDQVLALEPHNPNALNNKGAVLEKQGDWAQARECYKQAIASNPNLIDAYLNLARAHSELNEFEDAQRVAQTAIELAPENHTGYSAMASVLTDQGFYAESEPFFHKALECAPRNATNWYNLGFAYSQRSLFAEAVECYENALLINPRHDDAQLNAGLALLTLGQFDRAWGYYFKRPRYPKEGESFSPIQPGADYAGKHLFFTRAQGIGDEILFMRFLPFIRTRCAKISYRCNDKLHGVVERLPFVDDVLYENESTEADLLCSIDDLPLMLNIDDIAKIPPPVRFVPREDKVKEVAAALSGLSNRPLIGITWRAGVSREKEQRHGFRILSKEIELDQFAEILAPLDCYFAILQRNPHDEELEYLKSLLGDKLIDMSRYNDDLEGMLALLTRLDDYVGVSNTNMHLLAGLGKTAQVLVPNPPDWRWMSDVTESPWMPGFRIFRQNSEGSWEAALRSLAESVKQEYSTNSP